MLRKKPESRTKAEACFNYDIETPNFQKLRISGGVFSTLDFHGSTLAGKSRYRAALVHIRRSDLMS